MIDQTELFQAAINGDKEALRKTACVSPTPVSVVARSLRRAKPWMSAPSALRLAEAIVADLEAAGMVR